MSPTITTLALYVIGILGGFVIGYEIAKNYYEKRITLLLKLLCTYYERKLSKFHQLRGKNGRFINRQAETK